MITVSPFLQENSLSSLARASEVSNENVKFYTKLKDDRCMVSALQQDILAHVLRSTYSKDVRNFLVWAKICGSDSDLKCVNPFLLTCEFIKSETTVELEETEEIIDYGTLQQVPDNVQTEIRNTLFFISLSNRKNRERITKVHYKRNLRGRDICVVAGPSQSLKDAIIQDNRFVNVDRFTLTEKLERGEGSVVNMELMPSNIKEAMIIVVKVKKARQSSGKSFMTPIESDPSASSTHQSSVSDVETKEQSVAKAPEITENINKLGEKLWEENAFYVFSKQPNNLTKDEILSEMVKCLRARAWCTLVGQKIQEPKTEYENSLQELAKHEFANQNVASRPVRVTKRLMELYNSVGFLRCGSVTGTCFLVSENMIATNWHIVNQILTARNTSTPYDYRDVCVFFDYEESGNVPEYGYVLKDLRCKENMICEQLDYAFLHFEGPVKNVTPLGDLVRCKVPERGTVCIAGHPNGNEKQEEVCAILPLHEDRRARDLEIRYEECEWHCRNNQSGCALSYIGQNAGKCVHSYQAQLQQVCNEERVLTYDVGSMFEGASGAPVFDLKCNIVALHTAGFRLGKTSVVEYGVTFEAIIRHLEATHHSKFVREHFPNCSDESMHTD